MVLNDIETKIAKLELAPGDILVLKVGVHAFTPTMAENLRQQVKQALGPDHIDTRVLLLDRGMELSVLTKAQIEERA